jgi:glycosyltransferase involved in cell wall biosynthesis
MIKILVVGQTPPPNHGQAIMIREMLRAGYEGVKLYHVRMGFSREVDEIGKLRLGKVLHMFEVIIKIILYRLRYNIKVLYYPPAGPDKIPILRDLIILIVTRVLFKKTIFHFHAAGLSTMGESLSPLMLQLFRRAYFFPDAAVKLSDLNPDDSRFLQAKKEFIVPYGIDDHSSLFAKKKPNEKSFCRLLYVGMVTESKGIMTLLDACRALKENGLDFKLTVVGKFCSRDFQHDVTVRVADCGLGDHVEFVGVLTGYEKYAWYNRADIFCFPTCYEKESFGIVLLEAMQFSLPVVSTKWRGVQSVVRDGVTGFCVPVSDTTAFTQKLESLMRDPELRRRMGAEGRGIYQNEYTREKYRNRMQEVFLSAADEI